MSKAFDDWFSKRYPTTQDTLNPPQITNLVTLLTEAWQAGAQAALATKDAEIAALKIRLEDDPAHSYDGIDCRNETIKMQDEAIAALTAERDALRKHAVTEPERIRADERERCAQVVEQMTSRKRTIYGMVNSEPVADCQIAAAIRGL